VPSLRSHYRAGGTKDWREGMGNRTSSRKRKPGTYVSLTSGGFLTAEDSDRLGDGEVRGKHYRVPAPLVLLFGPVLALAYIIFVPLAGMASLAEFIWRKLKVALARPPLLDSDE